MSFNSRIFCKYIKHRKNDHIRITFIKEVTFRKDTIVYQSDEGLNQEKLPNAYITGALPDPK